VWRGLSTGADAYRSGRWAESPVGSWLAVNRHPVEAGVGFVAFLFVVFGGGLLFGLIVILIAALLIVGLEIAGRARGGDRPPAASPRPGTSAT